MPIDPYLEGRVLAADPVELIHILYEHALTQVDLARVALASGDIMGRGQAINKTIYALIELESSLNFETGGAISQNLARLYQYMRRRMTTANAKKDDAMLAEVQSLLGTLAEGWRAMQHGSVPVASVYQHEMAGFGANSWCA